LCESDRLHFHAKKMRAGLIFHATFRATCLEAKSERSRMFRANPSKGLRSGRPSGAMAKKRDCSVVAGG
jgi:hypothetical protein